MEGCLFNIISDPTEHVNLKESLPALFESMRTKLLAHGKTLYQTNYAEPGTGPVKAAGAGGGGGGGKCITGPEAREIYSALDVHGNDKAFLGPMCFQAGHMPPPPPPPPPGFRLTLAGGSSCLISNGKSKAPITLSKSCTAADKRWHFVTPSVATDSAVTDSWLAWEGQAAAPVFVKVNETAQPACKLGYVYSNPVETAGKQGFAAKAVAQEEGEDLVQLVSSLCPGMCLSVLAAGSGGQALAAAAHLAPCAGASKFTKEV